MIIRLNTILLVLCAFFSSVLFSSVQMAIAAPEKPKQPVYSEELRSLNGKWAVSSLPSINDAKSALFIWNVRTKKLVKKVSFSWSYVTPLAFSRSGRFLAISGTTVVPEKGLHAYLQIWDTRSWRRRRVLEDSSGAWTEVAWLGRFSDNGKVLTTVNYNRIEKWSSRSGKRFKTIPLGFVATDEGGLEARISKSGRLLLVASGASIALMQMNDGKVLRRFNRHADTDFVAFSPDEKTVIEIDSDGWFRVWKTQDGKTLRAINGNFGFPSFSKDSQHITLPSHNGMIVIDAKTGRRLEAISKVWSNGLDFWSWVPPKD